MATPHKAERQSLCGAAICTILQHHTEYVKGICNLSTKISLKILFSLPAEINFVSEWHCDRSFRR
jgi:hypothetical protein